MQGVTPANFTVRQGANPVLAGTVTQVGTTNQWALNPTANLAANTVYTVTLTGNASTGIRDAANNAVATTTWTFTTAAARHGRADGDCEDTGDRRDRGCGGDQRDSDVQRGDERGNRDTCRKATIRQGTLATGTLVGCGAPTTRPPG